MTLIHQDLPFGSIRAVLARGVLRSRAPIVLPSGLSHRGVPSWWTCTSTGRSIVVLVFACMSSTYIFFRSARTMMTRLPSSTRMRSSPIHRTSSLTVAGFVFTLVE